MTRVVAFALAVAAATVCAARTVYDPDLFWHLAQGREVLAGHLVRTNLFSAAYAAYPQHYTSWLFDAALALTVRVLGLGGVQLVQGALMALALAVLFASARARASATAALATLLVSLLVLEPRAMPRPYLMSWLALALTVRFWEGRQQKSRELIRRINSRLFSDVPGGFGALCLLLVVWANVHAEAVFGLAFLAIIVMLEQPRRWPWLLAAATATLVTPYGIGLWRYLAENAAVPSILRIAELQPPTPSTYPAFFAYLAVLGALIALDVARVGAMTTDDRRRLITDLVIVIVFAAFGLRYVRMMPLVVFVAAPVLAARVDALIARGWDRRAVLVTATAIAIATLPATPARMARAWRVGAEAVEPRDVFSPAAIAFARERGLTGPVFTSMNLGGWVAWSLPSARVSLDSRLQAYPPEAFARVLSASQAPEEWRALVSDVHWAVVSRARPNELSGVGQFSAEEWTSVFRDRAVEIFERRAVPLGMPAR